MIAAPVQDIEEFKTLYEQCGGANNVHKIDDIIALGNNMVCFYDNNSKLVGCIYLEDIKGKLYLNGFARRKSIDLVIEAIEHVCNRVICDVYAETPFKHAGLVLRRAGFEKICYNTYRRMKNGQKF